MSRNRKGWNLAYLLRHDKSALDKHGWREVEDLILNHGFTLPLLEEIVDTNNKRRYEFNEGRTKIRARQGHSVNVDVELKVCTPPDILYHGTSEDAVAAILEEGLKPGKRLHVHFSNDIETALQVGRRHGNPKVLRIDTASMAADGVKFYLSNNGIWLTDFVDPKFISLMESQDSICY